MQHIKSVLLLLGQSNKDGTGNSIQPSALPGFVPIKCRWVGEPTFGAFNFFDRLDKGRENIT